MRAEWYGDKRDLIKWGCLLALAKRRQANKIFQIAFCTETDWPKLQIGKDDDAVDLPECVRKHFRDVDKIQELRDGQVEIQILFVRPKIAILIWKKPLARSRNLTTGRASFSSIRIRDWSPMPL